MDTLIKTAYNDLDPALLQNASFPVMFLIVENSRSNLVTDSRSESQ